MTNEAVCHKWVHNPDKSWHNNSSNMSFGSRKLYSYSSVLAKNVDGVIHIDTHIANYSTSSQKQACHLRKSIPSYIDTFEYDFSAESAPHWYLEQCMDLLDKQTRARKRDYTSDVIKYLDESIKYMSIYKYDKRKSAYKQLMLLNSNRSNMLDSVADIIVASNKAKAASIRKNNKLMQEERQTKLDKFTGGGIKFDPAYNGVYLKVDGDKLYTTNSICVDIRPAQLLYKRWVAGKDILGAELSYYTVVKSTSKAVQIGCTVIGAHELHRIFGGL